MATKPKGPGMPFTAEDDIPDIPDEFFADDEAQPAGLSLEDLNAPIFDKEAYEEDYQRLNPPKGDWIKDERWETYTESVYNGSSEVGDISPLGRTYIKVSGRPHIRVANGLEYKPMFFISISPDKRYKAGSTTEFDMAYRLFIQVKDAYLSIHGERLKSRAQLKYFLEEDNYVIRSMNGDNGVVAVGIRANKVQR